MSLSTWEQQALDSIKDGLASSDPALVARLALFARLASGEDMPAREKIQPGPGPGRPPRRTRRRPRTRVRYQRSGLQRAVLLLWLLTTVALIAVAVVYDRVGGHGPCTGSWVTLCSGSKSASGSGPGMP
jgi:hypothetical protein